MDSTDQLQSLLHELQDENLHLRSALYDSLADLLALRESLPDTQNLNRCIMRLRIALAD